MRKIDDINWKNKDFCKEFFQPKGGVIKQGVFIKQYKVYGLYSHSEAYGSLQSDWKKDAHPPLNKIPIFIKKW